MKRLLHFIYAFGAAIILTGVLFKLNHYENGNLIFNIGLVAEIIVFVAYAFDTNGNGPSYKWTIKKEKVKNDDDTGSN